MVSEVNYELLEELKAGPVLRLTNPWSLLRNVWFHVVLYWCRRGRDGKRSLKPTSFEFAVDEQGRRYVTMTHDETSKNHPGGLQDHSSFEKTARMYETESETDDYRALSLYISKLNPKCEALFQQPRRDWKESAITHDVCALQDGNQKSSRSDNPVGELQTAVPGTVVETHSRSSTTAIHSEMLGGMFNSSIVGSVQINFYPPERKNQ
ncbi:hypothetical protein ACROYT_G027705 [Oculina patagonica]